MRRTRAEAEQVLDGCVVTWRGMSIPWWILDPMVADTKTRRREILRALMRGKSLRLALRDPRDVGRISRKSTVQGGAYCIAGTRMTVVAIKTWHRGGASIRWLAKTYDLEVADVVVAVGWRARR